MKLKISPVFFLIPTVLWGVAGGPTPVDVLATEQGFMEITAPEVKNMLDEKRAVVVHVLSSIEYEMQHITGTINIPINKVAASDRLPADKSTPLIFYCMGLTWPYNIEAARIAVRRGYTRVYAFVGGIPEWTTFNYPMTINESWQNIKVEKIAPKEFRELLKQPDILLLDIRPMEFEEKTFIKGAILCPLIVLDDHLNEIPKDWRILLSDIVMKQSPSAAKFLLSKGYKVEGVLKGGIERWNEEKLPTELREPPTMIGPLNIPPRLK